ncbi:HAD-IA family hydrolase [Candidatus Pacearchaeota archaeon]|nr:HAD-IA family hydrolase [Candidatus Pacearchaeota archaeon]
MIHQKTESRRLEGVISGLQKTYITESINRYMKTIFVDAVNTFVIKGEGIFEEMHKMLEKYPNTKIILTNANDEQMKNFGLDNMPYQVFSLKHDPEKTDPEYFEVMLKHFNLEAEEIIYFEHNEEAVKSAQSAGIISFHYDKDKKDLTALKKFIDENL